jgi:hypothetical protein
MHRGDLNVDVIPPAVCLTELDAHVREVHLLVVVRELVLARPILDLVRLTVWPAVVPLALAIAFVQPLLILAFELVIEDDPPDACAALGELLSFPEIGAIHLRVVLDFAVLDQAGVELLAMFTAAIDASGLE